MLRRQHILNRYIYKDKESYLIIISMSPSTSGHRPHYSPIFFLNRDNKILCRVTTLLSPLKNKIRLPHNNYFCIHMNLWVSILLE